MKLLRSCLLALILFPAMVSSAGADTIRQIHLPTKDLIYDSVSQKIYASVPSSAGNTGNSVTLIDPATGAIGPSIFVGSEPGQLAIADNGQYLYAVLDGAAAVGRVNLWTQTADLQVSLGSGYGPNYAEDIAVLPGHPESFAVCKYNRGISPRHVHIAVYDNDVQRPRVAAGVTRIEFSPRAERLYGYDNSSTGFGFLRADIDETGIVGGDWAILMTGFSNDIVYSDGRIFSVSGGIYDPEARTLLGVIPGGLIRPDPALDRIFILGQEGTVARVRIYDWNRFVPLGSVEIPGVSGGVGSFIRWGADGFAFRTSGDQVFFVQSPTLIGRSISFSLALNPGRVTGGTPVTGTVRLSEPAPADVVVTLASTNTAVVAVPSTLTVPAGATTATFPVATSPVPVATSVALTAVSSGISQTATLDVLPPTLTSVTIDPTRVTGGTPAVGTITLSAPAPASGVVVSLGSSHPSVAAVPGSLTMGPGAVKASFTITTTSVQTPTSVAILVATVEGLQTATLQVLPSASPPGNFGPPHPPIGGAGTGSVGGSSEGDGGDPAPTGVSALTFQPNPVVRGRKSTGTISLAAPAQEGGLIVTLASSEPGVARAPARVKVAAGATIATFAVTTGRARVPTDVSLFAAADGVTRMGTLTVLPAGIASITVRPGSVAGGSASTGTITLAYPAPAGGAVIALSSSKPGRATVPASVTVPEGARTVSFPITTSQTSAASTAVISASFAGGTTTARLTVRRR